MRFVYFTLSLALAALPLAAQPTVVTGSGLGRVTHGTAYTGAPYWNASYLGLNAHRTGANQWSFASDSANDGGVVLASEVGGFLRIIPVATAHTSGGRTLTDTQLFDMTRMTVKPGGVEISNPASTGLAVRVPHQFPYGYAILAEVGDPNTKSLVVSHAGAENFLVYGNGQVFAREVNVMTGTFPDYVFAPDYKLMPLNDLRRFVGQQRHLPHFPSGSEVVKQGMNLGDLQKRLVQQVEDLALYILQLEERLAAMESSSGRKGSSGQ